MRALIVIPMVVMACSGESRRSPSPPPIDATDRDGDGSPSVLARGPDCDDDDSRINPVAREVCNGRDENCDGRMDDGFDCVLGSERSCGGVASGWIERCNAECRWDPCAPPEPLSCPDDADGCAPGEMDACVTVCGEGTRSCDASCRWGDCIPPEEVCNELDDDCDGRIDEDAWGLTSDFAALPWTGWTSMVATARMNDGRIAVVHGTAPRDPPAEVIVLWLDPQRVALPGAAQSFTMPEGAFPSNVDAVAIGDGIGFLWGDESELHVGVARPEGVSASWVVDDVRGTLVALDDDLGVLTTGLDYQLLRFDAAGTATADPVPFPEHDGRGAAWTGEWIVVANGSDVFWVDLEGTVHNELRLEGGARAGTAVSVMDGLTAIAFRSVSDVIFMLVDSEGREQVRAREPLPEPHSVLEVEFGGPVAIDQGFLVWSINRPTFHETRTELIGWVLDREGNTMSRPDYWLEAPDFRWRAASAFWDVASDGTAASLVHSFDGLSVATLGCRVQ